MRTISTAAQLPVGAAIAIYGSGARGLALLEEVRSLPERRIQVRCFIDSFADGEVLGLPKVRLATFLGQDPATRGAIVVASEACTQIVWSLREQGLEADFHYEEAYGAGLCPQKSVPGAMSGFLDAHFPFRALPRSEAAGRPGFTPQGYTSRDVGERKDLNIMFLGCSWVADANQEQSFTRGVCDLFAQELGAKVSDWNLALGGESVDYLVRTLLCSLDALRPDLVFLVFTGLERAEYFALDGNRVRFQLDWLLEREKGSAAWRGLPRQTRETIEQLSQLYSPCQDVARFLKNYLLVEHALNARGIPWGFSMVPAPRVVEPIMDLMRSGWIGEGHYLGEPFEVVDYVSREDSHPGPISRERFAAKVHAWFNARHGADIRYIVAARRAAGSGA